MATWSGGHHFEVPPEVLAHAGALLSWASESIRAMPEGELPTPGISSPETTAMDELSSRFLDAFTAIEKHLRTLLDADRHMTFNEMVEKAARVDKGVRRLRGQLKDFGELRNFVVHEYRRDQPTASPSAHAVERLQAIRDELISPPRLIDLFRHQVETCAPTDPVGSAARKMHDGSFSQLPVYEEDRLVGLLTAETVAR
jgi:CBS domain